MGYSGRYHLASLVAVFVALAIGILIGIGLAGDVVTSASEELKQSLRSDLTETEDELDSVKERLELELQFEELAYPALVNRRLMGLRVGVVSLGEPDEELVADVREALEPAGAELASLTVIATPPETDTLLELAGPRVTPLADELESLEELGALAGGQIARGEGALLDRLRPVLLSRASGRPQGIDQFLFARSDPGELEETEAGQAAALDRGLIAGIDSKAEHVVGIERSGVEPTLLDPLAEAGIPTVDHLDLVAGRVSLVFALLGSEGDYGIKDEEDEYLPALIETTSRTP